MKILLFVLFLLIPSTLRADILMIEGVNYGGTGAGDDPSGGGGGGTDGPRRLLPLGDSITRGSGDSPERFGWRDHLQGLLGVGVFDFVGNKQDPLTSATYDIDHAGVGGDESYLIEGRLIDDQLLQAYFSKPSHDSSAVLIHSGTNDCNNAALSLSAAVTNVEDMINYIDAYDSSIDIYVALIIPSKTSATNTRINTYNGLLLTMLEAKQATKTNLYIVDMNTAFLSNPSWGTAYMADNLHPNNSGYVVMAEEWYDAMRLQL